MPYPIRPLRSRCVAALALVTVACGGVGAPANPIRELPVLPGDDGADPSSPPASGAGEPDSSTAARDSGSDPTGCPTFASSFEALQKVIFEGHGCTASACHGAAASGGLDLRAGAAWQQLVEAKSTSSHLARVQPGSATDSFLYQKLAAATNPGMVKTTGSPMPVGAAALSADELEAVRIWIMQSAPETGNVGDPTSGDTVGTLLAACVPPPQAIKAVPLKAPAPSEGVQFVLPRYLLKSGTEVEQCTPFAYDFTDKVPAQYKDVARNVMFVNGTRVLQDPTSHHMVVWNPAKDLASVPASGWACAGGARHGEPCSGSNVDCGSDSVCAGPPTPGSLCSANTQALAGNTLDPVAALAALADLLAGGGLPSQVANTQSPQEYVPPFEGGVYAEVPLKGVLWFDSHAFNLTEEDTTLDARMNFLFAKEQKRLMLPTNIIKNDVPNGLAPFTKKTYCATTVVPQNYSIAMMTGHTHRRGKHFWANDSSGKQIYESFVYNDPAYVHYEPWLEFGASDEATRTIEFCAEFNNGVKPDGTPDVELVTRKSRMPPPSADCTPVACTAGKVGAPCSTHSDCDSTAGKSDGECDACPITTGLTTENEMFVLMPWYIAPPKN